MPVLPVYAIVSKEPYLQLGELHRVLGEAGADVDRVDLDGEKAELGDALDELRSFAMFGGRRLVVVRDADKFITNHREGLERYLQSPSDTGTLVLRASSLPSNQRVHKLITRVGRVIVCEPPKERDLPAWIVRHAKAEYALDVAPDAARALADLIGADLGRIDTELAKLAIMCDGNRLTTEQIASSVAFSREQEMWTLTDVLSSGDVTRALRLWRQLLQTDPAAEFRAATWLTLWLAKLSAARRLAARKMPHGSIASTLKIWPAQNLDGLLRIGDRLGDEGIRAALERLAQADLRSKTGIGEFDKNVEAFLLSLR